jgi:hypothetical protein
MRTYVSKFGRGRVSEDAVAAEGVGAEEVVIGATGRDS